MTRQTVTTRSQLLTLLTEACEIEHGLACSYLYAAITLKQDLSEGGMDWQQLQRVRAWAGQIYFVAAQEMLHLAQVWNLQTSIGGTPYYLRPNFPQPSGYYPLNLPMRLERFSLGTLDRFIQFERPADVIIQPESALGGPPAPSFDTVGELYELIAEGFRNVPGLFIGSADRQVDQRLVDFPDLLTISSSSDAIRAVQQITRQGEGTAHARQDSHFGTFREIRKQYLIELARSEESGLAFEPVRSSISNPVAKTSIHLAPPGANPVTDPWTEETADCFDSIYSHMLRLLQYVFDNAASNSPVLEAFGHGAIEAMAAVIKPLGEALTLMPAGPQYEHRTAGPGFVLARHIALPSDPVVAATLNAERFEDLSERLAVLAANEVAVSQLRNADRNMREMAQRFRTLAEEMRRATPHGR